MVWIYRLPRDGTKMTKILHVELWPQCRIVRTVAQIGAEVDSVSSVPRYPNSILIGCGVEKGLYNCGSPPVEWPKGYFNVLQKTSGINRIYIPEGSRPDRTSDSRQMGGIL